MSARIIIIPIVSLLTSWAGLTFAQDNQTLRLQLLEVRDPGINNEVAFTMLIPVGWRTAGGIEWRQNQSNLATAHITVSSPDGQVALESFPIVPCTWTQGGVMGFPTGSNYLGNIVYPPITDAAQYIGEAILPQYRQGIEPKMVAREPLAKVAQSVSQAVAEAGMQKQVIAERVRLAYQWNGRDYEEDYYVALVFATGPMLPDTTFWQANQQYAFRAPAGQLEKYAPLLNAMVSSVRVQPKWFAGYQYVVQLWRQNQMQAIRNAGELSRRIAQNSDQIMRMNQEAYENRERSNDRIAHQWSETIRGVETYHDPYADRDVELPNDYKDVWVNPNGEYILSNDVNFNPNETGDTQQWQRAPVAPE